MKRSNPIFIGWQGVILAIAVIVAGLLESAYCKMDRTVLLLQQTPPQGGEISPSAGLHHFDLNTEVTLTAIPKPSYKFVYWLGDVSEPTANSTVVYLDAPKIVIAVFVRDEYEFLAVEERTQSALGGDLIARGTYSRQGFIPEPAMVLLLGLGTLILRRRRIGNW